MNLIKSEVQREILIYAFRYALGRRTYASKDMADAIIYAWPNLSEGDKALFKSEIESAINDGLAGSECDVNEWKKVLGL